MIPSTIPAVANPPPPSLRRLICDLATKPHTRANSDPRPPSQTIPSTVEAMARRFVGPVADGA